MGADHATIGAELSFHIRGVVTVRKTSFFLSLRLLTRYPLSATRYPVIRYPFPRYPSPAPQHHCHLSLGLEIPGRVCIFVTPHETFSVSLSVKRTEGFRPFDSVLLQPFWQNALTTMVRKTQFIWFIEIAGQSKTKCFWHLTATRKVGHVCCLESS